MTSAKDNAVEERNDLSRFVIHLTRDDRDDFDDGASAAENFGAIVEDRRILALRPHCLHADRIPKKHRRRLSVCCFTEVPLSELHLLTRHIQGRRIELSEYGLVFSREFVVSKEAQPALYINSYGGNFWLREAADKICDIAKDNDFRKGKLWRLLPYLNAMHERYDFTWEREWRMRGDLEFTPGDIVCVILPEKHEDEWKRKFLQRGVPVISPGWSTERIVSELSGQARRARQHWVARKRRVRRVKRERDAVLPSRGVDAVKQRRSPTS